MSIPVVTASCYTKGRKLIVRDRKVFDAKVAELPDGWELEMEVSRLRATRGQQANRYYWGVVIKAIADHTGYTPEEVHDLMKAKFLPREFVFLDIHGEVIEQYVLSGSTRKMPSDRFARYVEQIKEWAAGEPLLLYIPDADQAGYGAGV